MIHGQAPVKYLVLVLSSPRKFKIYLVIVPSGPEDELGRGLSQNDSSCPMDPWSWWQWCWHGYVGDRIIMLVTYFVILTIISIYHLIPSPKYTISNMSPTSNCYVTSFDLLVNLGASSQWSSSLYCPIQNPDQMTTGKTHLTLIQMIMSFWTPFKANFYSSLFSFIILLRLN